MTSLDAATDLLHVLGDPTRLRLLALLAHHELTVAELTAALEVPQSRVSTHLGKLRDAGLLRDRRDGASSYYAASGEAMPESARRLWDVLGSQISDAVLERDRERAERLQQSRNGGAWPDSIAGEMERHYSPGRTWEATARGLLGFVELGDVLDIGAGDGAISELVAPRARSITCLDRSERVIDAARKRLANRSNVRFALGDMHELPFADQSFDQVLCFNVLTYSHSPARALAEITRVLRAGGSLALVTLGPHEHTSITQAYGHSRAGFSPEDLDRMLAEAGLSVQSSAVTSRERKKPYFEVVSAFARRPIRA